MVQSKAATVKEYLESLPEERRAVIAKVREMILRNLPDGYRERMNWGMISYEVPLERYPSTYNKQPLVYVSLASQKNYNALYLTGSYGDGSSESFLKKEFAKAGKKLDMGKSCLRFRSLDDLPLAALGKLIASVPVDRYIERYEKSRA